MPDEIKIRIATVEDVAEIARLNTLFNGSLELPEAYAARLVYPQRVETPVLAEINGRVIGFAALRLAHSVFYAEPHAELTEMFVEEPYRRRGVGHALIAHVERMAREGGAHELIVQTDFYNHGAQELYRACGYVHHDIALSKSLQE